MDGSCLFQLHSSLLLAPYMLPFSLSSKGLWLSGPSVSWVSSVAASLCISVYVWDCANWKIPRLTSVITFLSSALIIQGLRLDFHGSLRAKLPSFHTCIPMAGASCEFSYLSSTCSKFTFGSINSHPISHVLSYIKSFSPFPFVVTWFHMYTSSRCIHHIYTCYHPN